MKLVVISHTAHWKEKESYFAYGPYVREMNLWIENFEEIEVVAPLGTTARSEIHWQYNKSIKLQAIPSVSLLGFRQKIQTLFKLPRIWFAIYRAMRYADHIHLRCPGNIGLIGCFVQVFYPKKRKTAKYAGNWDPSSKQPWSYRLQKWILSNTYLTRNMNAMVYGEWPGQSSNVMSFFTASYVNSKKTMVTKSSESPYRFLFVGSLVKGKQPEYAIKLIHRLKQSGLEVLLDLYGDGSLKTDLADQVQRLSLENCIQFHGNKDAEVVERAYKKSHFLILPSKSEGWPKVVAEAMFWGCIPIVTPVSCVPWMLDQGNRGVLLKMEEIKDSQTIELLIKDEERITELYMKAQQWSQQYTLDRFSEAINDLCQ